MDYNLCGWAGFRSKLSQIPNLNILDAVGSILYVLINFLSQIYKVAEGELRLEKLNYIDKEIELKGASS